MVCTVSSRHLPDLKPCESLEKFIDRHLRPTDHFKSYMSKSVDKVVRYLHQFKQFSIKEIVKSGSLGKGTCYGETADVDLVVFFNGYKDMESFLKDKPTILRDIEKYMCGTEPETLSWFGWFRCSKVNRPQWIDRIRVVRTTNYHVELEVEMLYRERIVSIKVDILPAIDIIYMRSGLYYDGVKWVYQEMETKHRHIQEHYSVCFCKRQKTLFDGRMAKVKDLVRLLKYWRTKNGLKLKSYSCEVLALWVYRNRLNENKSFKMADGFKQVLIILASVRSINDILPNNKGMKSEYVHMDCFKDPTNPYSTTLPFTGITNLRNCATDTLQFLVNGEEKQTCVLM